MIYLEVIIPKKNIVHGSNTSWILLFSASAETRMTKEESKV